MSRYAEIHTVLWCQSLQTLCTCKYFEARVTTLVVSMHLEPQFLTCTLCFPLIVSSKQVLSMPTVPLWPRNKCGNPMSSWPHWPWERPHRYCEKNSPSHWKQDDRGKHLPGFDLGFFVSLWDDYLFQLKKLHCFTGSAIKYLDVFFFEMECDMLSLPVQVAQRSSSLAVHKSPTL